MTLSIALTPSERSTAALTADEIQAVVREYIEGADNPDVLAYGGEILRHYGPGRWVIEDMMRLGKMRNARVLDVGCGFGWQALLIALLGGNDVVANDIRESMIDVVDSRAGALGDTLSAAGGSVTPLLGDICSLNVEDESFDAIFCNQTVEHIHDLPPFFKTAARVLRPGGWMVIANDNNTLNPKQFAEFREMWRRRDRSHDYIEQLKRERPIENAGIEPYAVMRENIIRRVRSELAQDVVASLADATAGMVE